MPGFDGTGPAGMGPMTGGARGWCAPYGGWPSGYAPYAGPLYGGAARGYWYGRPRWGLRMGPRGGAMLRGGFWGPGRRGRGRGGW